MLNLAKVDDYKDVTTKQYVDGEVNKLKPVLLWSGNSSSGNLIISDSVDNYSFIEVYYQNRSGHTSYSKLYVSAGKVMSLRTGNGESSDGYDIYTICSLNFGGTEGKTVTRSGDRVVNIHNNTYPTVSQTVNALSYYTLTITDIIGYK